MRQFLYKTLFAFFLGLILPQMVFAAEIFFEQEKNFGLKDQFKMSIFFKTEEPLNAIEGKINFPLELLELKDIDDGNSLINLWPERPREEPRGQIVFSGIIPGGYIGEKGLILSMTFLVRREGKGMFEIRDARVLLNDGKGTMAQLQTFDSLFVIVKKTSAIEFPASVMKDADMPESFVPEIAKDAMLFDGKWFVVFATQDKVSGIDHYEIKESRQRTLSMFKKWTSAESPYVLRDQELRSIVFVMAVDKAGNERIIKIAPRNPLSWHENYENWIMIIVGICVAIFISKKLCQVVKIRLVRPWRTK